MTPLAVPISQRHLGQIVLPIGPAVEHALQRINDSPTFHAFPCKRAL